LKNVGLWDVNPLNLFRITWHNEPVASGGGFGGVNYLEFPPELTGVKARIFSPVGKWFPTGAHKVGAAFSCLVPRLVTGQFDPTTQKAVWPSTGNYCRGGAYDSALLGCQSIAILPEGMSRERFEWLSKVAGEVIATPGTESNVKEIFDKCWELRRSGQDLMIFNQFEEFGNHLWHYDVTGHAMEEVMQQVLKPGETLRGSVFTTGSAGTIGAGDYLKEIFPHSKLGASEALQCPTLYMNGFGAHRIEGIGDKHVPWIHNVKNTDMVVAVDDEAPIQLIRLFNEPEGKKYLAQMGVPEALIAQLPLLGISGIANVLSAIKMAKWYEWGEGDAAITVLTDSMELYGSRLRELTAERGEYTARDAAVCTIKRWGSYPYMEELRISGGRRVRPEVLRGSGQSDTTDQAQWYRGITGGVHGQSGDRCVDQIQCGTGCCKDVYNAVVISNSNESTMLVTRYFPSCATRTTPL
jgi:cysteine synthase